MSLFPRISTPQLEGELQVSKALKFQVLLDAEEMRTLLESLPACNFFMVSEVVNKETAALSVPAFLERYREYVETLKRGEIPNAKAFRGIFSSVLTTSLDILYAQQVGDDRFLIKSLQPIIQLQKHHFFLSDVDGKYHPMIQGDDSISWGLQFSYPQIAQDPKTSNFSKVDDSFVNTQLFSALSKALRKLSVPTPFIYRDVKTNVPIRLGKQCFTWIEKHPQLIKKGVQVCALKS